MEAFQRLYPRAQIFNGKRPFGLVGMQLEGEILQIAMRQLRLLDVFALSIHDAIAVNEKNYEVAKSAMEDAWLHVMHDSIQTRTFLRSGGESPDSTPGIIRYWNKPDWTKLVKTTTFKLLIIGVCISVNHSFWRLNPLAPRYCTLGVTFFDPLLCLVFKDVDAITTKSSLRTSHLEEYLQHSMDIYHP